MGRPRSNLRGRAARQHRWSLHKCVSVNRQLRTSRRILEAWGRWFCHLRCAFSGSDYLEDGGPRLSIRCERHWATRVETLWGARQLEANRGRGRLCAAHVGDGGGGSVEAGKMSFDSRAAARPASICSIPGRKRRFRTRSIRLNDDELASTKLWAIFIDSIWTSIFTWS